MSKEKDPKSPSVLTRGLQSMGILPEPKDEGALPIHVQNAREKLDVHISRIDEIVADDEKRTKKKETLSASEAKVIREELAGRLQACTDICLDVREKDDDKGIKTKIGKSSVENQFASRAVNILLPLSTSGNHAKHNRETPGPVQQASIDFFETHFGKFIEQNYYQGQEFGWLGRARHVTDIVVDNKGSTRLHDVVNRMGKEDKEITADNSERYREIRDLVQRGEDPLKKNHEGKTPLQLVEERYGTASARADGVYNAITEGFGKMREDVPRSKAHSIYFHDMDKRSAGIITGSLDTGDKIPDRTNSLARNVLLGATSVDEAVKACKNNPIPSGRLLTDSTKIHNGEGSWAETLATQTIVNTTSTSQPESAPKVPSLPPPKPPSSAPSPASTPPSMPAPRRPFLQPNSGDISIIISSGGEETAGKESPSLHGAAGASATKYMEGNGSKHNDKSVPGGLTPPPSPGMQHKSSNADVGVV